MTARAEADELRRILHLGLALVVLALEASEVHEHGRRGWLAGQRGNRAALLQVVDHHRLHHDTAHGLTCQMSAAYSEIVRSLETFPDPATFRMAVRAHAAGSAYSARRRPSASR